MRNSFSNIQKLATAFVVLVAIIALGKTVRVSGVAKTAPQPRRQQFLEVLGGPMHWAARTYDISLLNEEAAAPGKIVRAVKDGRIVGSYTCTSQDAEVAWFFDDAYKERGGGMRFKRAGPWVERIAPDEPVATDEDHRPFPFTRFEKGPLIRIVFPKGYASKPKSISFKLYDGLQTWESHPTIKTVQLTHFADPARCVPRASQPETAASESILKADCNDFPGGRSAVQFEEINPTEKDLYDRHEFQDFRILSSSYCPEGIFEPEFYFNETDTVRVCVDRYKVIDKMTYLVYKNPQLALVNGVRTLRLPTTQDVGFFANAKALIRKLLPVPVPRGSHALAVGSLTIHIERKLQSDVKYGPRASLASIYPPVDSLGLDLLKIRVVDSGLGSLCGEDIRPSGAISQTPLTNIREIKIGVLVSTPVKISSKTLVLPLHHLAADRHIGTAVWKGSGYQPLNPMVGGIGTPLAGRPTEVDVDNPSMSPPRRLVRAGTRN